METNYSCGENAFENPSQSRLRNQHFFPFQSKLDFNNRRFAERNSYPRIPLSVNRAKLSIPYKSELCRQFQRGKCYFGENCHYAHGMSEIGRPGFKTAEHLNEDSQRNAMCRVRVCYFTSSGRVCPYGDNCHFLHKCYRNAKGDSGLCGESCTINAVNGRSESRGSDHIDCMGLNGDKDHVRSVFYKTKLCLKWERFGSCPYGVKCRYAHGDAELQEWRHFADVEQDRACRLMLEVQPNNAASCEVGIKTAEELKTKGKRDFMKWDIEKISQIYGDWTETD